MHFNFVWCMRGWWLIWHFMANGIFFEFDASHYVVVVLLVLEATVVLPIAWTRLLKLYCQGPKVVLPSWDQISTTKKAMRQLQLWDSYQRPWSKTDLSKDCALTEKVKLQSCRERPVFWMQSRFVLCLQVFAFLMVDLTFHGQWHIFGVRLRPLCRGSFVCLGSNRSLANRVHATVEVVLARSQKLSSQAETRSLQQWRPCHNYNVGTATGDHGLKWRDCGVQKSKAAIL